MGVKSYNSERLLELHNIISEGIHKVEDLEENVKSLFIALMNPEDEKAIEGWYLKGEDYLQGRGVAKDYAEAGQPELEKYVRTTGFYRNKDKSVKAAGQALVARHGGVVPKTMEELVHLPGVGRKTANVVLGTGYGIASGVVVDTHVGRIAARLGLVMPSSPEKMEKQLMEVIPKRDWILFSHQLIYHGRAVCKAQRPNCPGCVLNKLCPSAVV